MTWPRLDVQVWIEVFLFVRKNLQAGVEIVNAYDLNRGGQAALLRVDLSNGESIVVKDFHGGEYEPYEIVINLAVQNALGQLPNAEDNIVSPYCTQINRENHFIAMPFVDGLSLFDLLEFLDKTGSEMEENAKLYIAKRLIIIVKWLQSFRVVHRDIKPENIMITIDGEVKLIDFDMACCFDDSKLFPQAGMEPPNVSVVHLFRWKQLACGTPCYTAPEIEQGRDYNATVDWFSVGRTLEMLNIRSSRLWSRIMEEMTKAPEFRRLLFQRPNLLHCMNEPVPPGTQMRLAKLVGRAMM